MRPMQDVGMSQTFEDVAKAPTEAITQTQAWSAHVLGGTLSDHFMGMIMMPMLMLMMIIFEIKNESHSIRISTSTAKCSTFSG